MQEGKIVLYPTETFYAVGCSVFAEQALQRVFGVKKRPLHKALPVLAASLEHVHAIAQINEQEEQLAKAFWPGPLTLLCKAKAVVPAYITAGTGKVAVRISSHPTAKALARALDAPLVCSSANLSGEAPPRLAQDISLALLDTVQAVITEGPDPQGGLPSTIVELCDGVLHIRRQGAVSAAQLQAYGVVVACIA